MYTSNKNRENVKCEIISSFKLTKQHSVEAEDEDSWDFGTVKQAPPQLQKPALQMHNSPSQYSMTSLANDKYQQSPPTQQLPRTVSRNQVNPQPHQSPPNSRVNEVTVSCNRGTNYFECVLIVM